jgi:zinc protease
MNTSFQRVAAAASCLLLGAAPLPAATPVPAAVAPMVAPVPDETSVTRATLPNGLRVVIVRDALAPVVTVYENYLVGADETPEGFPGMAHAQEHMAFRGCADLSADQTSAIFAQLGGDGDADTQQNLTQFYESVPAANLGVALRVDASCMRDIEDSDQQWQQERPAIEQEVASDLSNPSYKAINRLSADLFSGTPYAHDALGTRDSFDKTTGATLKAFERTWYAPNNAVLVITGDVDAHAVLATVTSLYGSIPQRSIPARPAIELQPVKSESFDLDSDLPYALTFTAYRMPGTSDPDYAAARVLVDVLGSERADIYALTAQGKALQTGVQMAASYPKAGMALVFGALPVGGNTVAFAATLADVVAAYARTGVPPELVDAAKRGEIAGAQFNRNSISDLGSTWSQAVADEGRTSPDEDVAAIQNVTPDDVDRAAKKYLIPSNAVTANLIPKPSGKTVSAKGFGGGETLTSAPTKAVVLPSWAQAELAQINVPNSTISPSDQTLPNGLRLIVQPETASDTVTVIGEINQNPALEVVPGKEGVDAVLGSLFSYGTTTLDRLAYQKALDDIAAQASAGSSFSLQVLKSKFDAGVALLADDELHPALPANAFAIVRLQTAQAVAGEASSPSYLAQRAIDKALEPAGDPGLREATIKSIAGLTLDDVKLYDAAAYRPDMTTIVVIGNVTTSEARATIEKYFGDWKVTGPKPTVDLPPIASNKPSAATVPDGSRVQDQTSLVETVPIVRSNPDYYALQLGDHVLGGGFYATRLYRDLRQTGGLVYDVDNRLTAGRTRSLYSVTFGSDPQNVSKARQLVTRDLTAMQTTDVSDAELQQAKAILLRQLPLAEASEDGVASALASRSLAGLPLDEAHRAALIYAKITAGQIRAAFGKYVRPNGFVQVVQGPNPS